MTTATWVEFVEDVMNALKNNERGLSLVEVTIMLLVLMLLTSVLAPSMADFINDAKWVKVKEDCEAIGLSVMRLTRDVGPCIKFRGTEGCSRNNRVDLMHSDGTQPDSSSVPWTAPAVSSPNLYSGTLNWDTAWRSDSLENQLVTNGSTVPYKTPTENGASQAGLQFGLGWRGAYLSSPIGGDPWGHAYMVNSAFLAVATDSTAMDARADCSHDARPGVSADCGGGGGGSSNEGSIAGGWSYDTFCLSAGPNGLYESPIGGNGHGGHVRGGDDFTYVISGGTR